MQSSQLNKLYAVPKLRSIWIRNTIFEYKYFRCACYYIFFHRYNSHCSFDICLTRRYCNNLHAFVCGTKPGVRFYFNIQFYEYYSLYLPPRWQIERSSFTYCYIYKKERNSYQRISMQNYPCKIYNSYFKIIVTLESMYVWWSMVFRLCADRNDVTR